MCIVSNESIKESVATLKMRAHGAEKCRSMVNLGQGPRETTEILHCCHKILNVWPM